MRTCARVAHAIAARVERGAARRRGRHKYARHVRRR